MLQIRAPLLPIYQHTTTVQAERVLAARESSPESCGCGPEIGRLRGCRQQRLQSQHSDIPVISSCAFGDVTVLWGSEQARQRDIQF